MGFNSQKRITKSALSTVNYGEEKSYIYVNKTKICKGDCILLGFYAAGSGHFLSTIWDKISVPSSGLKNPQVVPKRR